MHKDTVKFIRPHKTGTGIRGQRYVRMNNGYGYLCPKCREVIFYDRKEQQYYCWKPECAFRESKAEYARTLKDIRTTLARGGAILNANVLAKREAEKAARAEVLASVVYYIRFRDVIKIGTTGDLKNRMADIPFEEILALEPGDTKLERARHRQFGQYRVHGEWFEIHDDLTAHIEQVRSSNVEWIDRQFNIGELPWSYKSFGRLGKVK